MIKKYNANNMRVIKVLTCFIMTENTSTITEKNNTIIIEKKLHNIILFLRNKTGLNGLENKAVTLTKTKLQNTSLHLCIL